MNVISGKYKRKKLLGFNLKETRPTMDRVKESMFAMIQNHIDDSVCLDLFAGSGALGIEALSMGAKKCYFVDNNNDAIKVINKNLVGVEEEKIIIRKDYQEALKLFEKNKIIFDIIFLDPPYKKYDIEHIIENIIKKKIIKKNGLIIVETNESININLNLYKSRKISDKQILIYKVL